MTAPRLTVLQRCPRRYKIEESGLSYRWKPTALLSSMLRAAIFKLSSGTEKTEVAREFSTQILERAANPGIETQHDPYTLARDLTAILANVIEWVSRSPLLVLRPGPAMSLQSGATWECTAFQDDSGVLHRWATVDKLDADSLTRELHSWHVFGDCAAAQVPMRLHLIEIGSQRSGRQHTPWCKAYAHPHVMGRFAFQQKDGKPLQGNWKPVWFQDSGRNEPATWVDLMARDQVSLIRTVDVKQPTVKQCEEFRRQVISEGLRAGELPGWEDIPLFRPACDIPVCPHQATHCFRA